MHIFFKKFNTIKTSLRVSSKILMNSRIMPKSVRSIRSFGLRLPKPHDVTSHSVRVSVQNILTQEMDKLRQHCFPSAKPMHTSLDEFDSKSQHIVITIQDTLAAYGRLTAGPAAVFEKWTQGRANIPTGKEVIDLGRCLVNPKFRGLGLLELVILTGLMRANDQGYQHVVGTYVPGEKVGEKLHKLGFVNSGTTVYEDETGGVTVLVQPVTCNVIQKKYLWQPILEANTAFLNSKGYTLAEFPSCNLRAAIRQA